MLVGGGEWSDGCRELDAELFASSGADEVLVFPTAKAYEQPDRVGARAVEYFESLDAAPEWSPCCIVAKPRTPSSRPKSGRLGSSTSPTARRCTSARC